MGLVPRCIPGTGVRCRGLTRTALCDLQRFASEDERHLVGVPALAAGTSRASTESARHISSAVVSRETAGAAKHLA